RQDAAAGAGELRPGHVGGVLRAVAVLKRPQERVGRKARPDHDAHGDHADDPAAQAPRTSPGPLIAAATEVICRLSRHSGPYARGRRLRRARTAPETPSTVANLRRHGGTPFLLL